jgi:hypothetical protein
MTLFNAFRATTNAGGYGSRLKAGTTMECVAATSSPIEQLPQHVVHRLANRSKGELQSHVTYDTVRSRRIAVGRHCNE